MKAKHLQKSQLRLQELETRLVPSTPELVGSTNWSGYAVSGSNGSATYVAGTWTVPTTTETGKGTYDASSWVGIDGVSSNSVEQLGTDAQVVNGKTTYYAWYEMYPAGVVVINSITVKPGDTITASVSYSNGVFTLSLTDGSQPAFSINKTDASAARSSVEWIEEAPSSSSGVIPLADFGTVNFSNASATVSGLTAAINGFPDTTYQIDMVTRTGALKDTTSALNSSGTGFSVKWDSSGPTGGGGNRGPEVQDPVAYSINLSNPITSPTPQGSSFSSSASATAMTGPTSNWWVPNATPRQTYYASPQIVEISLDRIRKSIDSPISPAIEDIWLGKPMHGDLPQTPVKTDEIFDNGVTNTYLADEGVMMRTYEENQPSLSSASNRQDSALPALAGFLGVVFLGGSALKPPAKKSSRRVNPEE